MFYKAKCIQFRLVAVHYTCSTKQMYSLDCTCLTKQNVQFELISDFYMLYKANGLWFNLYRSFYYTFANKSSKSSRFVLIRYTRSGSGLILLVSSIYLSVCPVLIIQFWFSSICLTICLCAPVFVIYFCSSSICLIYLSVCLSCLNNLVLIQFYLSHLSICLSCLNNLVLVQFYLSQSICPCLLNLFKSNSTCFIHLSVPSVVLIQFWSSSSFLVLTFTTPLREICLAQCQLNLYLLL